MLYKKKQLEKLRLGLEAQDDLAANKPAKRGLTPQKIRTARALIDAAVYAPQGSISRGNPDEYKGRGATQILEGVPYDLRRGDARAVLARTNANREQRRLAKSMIATSRRAHNLRGRRS